LIAAFIILSTCIGCDQVTKSMATHSLRDRPPQSYLNGTTRIEYALNPGGFLSLGSKLAGEFRPWVFIGVNSCLLLALCVFLFVRRHLPFTLFVAMLFILAGGIGNLIDRVFSNGLVTDFLTIGIGPLRTGIFNAADIAVTVGAIAAVVLMQKGATLEQPDALEPESGPVSHDNSPPPAQ
jgi:signal peptidase II